MNQKSRHVELLQIRLILVSDISGANAEALKINQNICGLQMELLRLSMDDATQNSDNEQRETEIGLAEAEAALAECARRIEALEDLVAELDRQLALLI
ncbi:hypothetical protein HDIA_3879 [Hartmannibacter diazotrophicus]|uniref:Uncharacterized protein n=1 Tax=Hartmannibacter diazotrophicus TaxID=1482074 RepID=A0A2C9DB77_9HYPH|nr:hypothetical protein [Hartmannibacter diazotrophicus]SON57420.1 hypothetical protein HDIA_3879 [Hartmannibacter diazotrophicus]